MKSKIIIASCSVLFVAIVIGIYVYLGPILVRRGNMAFDENTPQEAAARASSKRHNQKTQPVVTNTSFTDNFSTDYTVVEGGNMGESNNPNWWISSGAYLYSKNGLGSTIMGTLPVLDPWRVAYSLSNSLDTDNGYYPQNIFRMVLRSQWQNFQQEACFKIVKDNLSASPNRNSSNGLLFFNRYKDAFNLYYIGIRVDGYATIKKKINSVYYTLAYKRFIDGPAYNRDTSPTLLPKNIWIGLRSVVKNNSDGTVNIKVYVDNGRTGNWVLVAEANDDCKAYGGSCFSGAGYAGIRTDFMDVQFDDYKISQL